MAGVLRTSVEKQPVTRSRDWILVAIVVMVGALAATAAAWATDFVACESGPGTEACGRRGLAQAQLWVAVGGLIPAGLTVWAAFDPTRSRVPGFALASLIVYLTWAVLNDAAVHGWGADMRLVP
jgi:hypothetical protein